MSQGRSLSLPRLFAGGILVVGGLASSALGLLVDVLRGDASPGFGSAQVALIVVGGMAAALGLLVVGLRGSVPDRKVLSQLVRGALLAAMGCLIALEIGLSFSGPEPVFSGEATDAARSKADWWVCDDLGCRFDQVAARRASRDRSESADWKTVVFFDRLEKINAQGFPDEDEFVVSSIPREGLRILVLGSSFTFGFYASPNDSWVEVTESRLGERNEVTIWNLSIPAASSAQQKELLRHFLPMLEPDLVITGFYPGTHLDGNLFPVDGYYALSNGGLLPKYRLGRDLEAIEMSFDEALFRVTGTKEKGRSSGPERLLGSTRVGSRALQGWARLQPEIEWLWSSEARNRPGKAEKMLGARSRTRELIGDMKAIAEDSGAVFHVLLIPGPGDLGQPGERYSIGRSILEELAIEPLEVRSLLAAADYIPGNEHWNGSGHSKVGLAVAESIEAMPIVGWTRREE